MSAHLGGDPEAAGQLLHEISLTPRHRIGERVTTNDGRVFRYAKAGAVDLVAGNALQAPAPVANHLDLTPSAAAIGDLSISLTLGATAATAGQYAAGLAIISTTPGNGMAYRISGHAAIGSAGAGVINLEDPIQVALTTSSRVDLYANPYNGVIQTPVTTLTGAVVGAAPLAVTAANFFWMQVRGLFGGLIDGTPAVGQGLSCPGAAAGAFAINSGTLPIVAYAVVVGVTAKNKGIFLTLE
jgi:hypothetical protein